MHDCSSKCVLVVRDDGEYSSASDFDEDTIALLADDHEGNDDHLEEHIGLGGFETHRSGFKSKEMNPATLAPRILWLSAELLLD
jgi:hypothetical protein